MPGFKKTTQELTCGMQTDRTQLRCEGVTSPVTPPQGCTLHGIFHWLLLGRELIFTWPWLVDTRKKWLLACCVSDSCYPTRWEVALGSDDSSFMVVWDSPIWGPWHHPYRQLGRAWQKGGAHPHKPWDLGVLMGVSEVWNTGWHGCGWG